MIGLLPARRWRRPQDAELSAVVRRLEEWSAPSGGAVRHLLPLAAIGAGGAAVVRITGAHDDARPDGSVRLGVVVRVGRDTLAVAGDGRTISRAVGPSPTWRLLVGDVGAADALLGRAVRGRGVLHDQRYLVIDHGAVPGASEVPDPGVRRAEAADVERLADLAVRLHIDDGFGPDPGQAGRRGYRDRLAGAVRDGAIEVVGPLGRPVAKLERTVDHPRYGLQLAGIVVEPDQRGRGIGRGLVAAVVRAAREDRLRSGRRPPVVTLHARADNAAALVAYTAAGFRVSEPWRLAIA